MTILQSLDRYYGRMAARGDVVAPGWSVEPIGNVLILSREGDPVSVMPWREPSGKKARQDRVPKWFGRSGTGSTPYFLWDNTAYALGVSDKDPGKTARDHAAFRKLHLEVLAGVDDEGLQALVRFLERWEPARFVEPLFSPALFKFNLAFGLEGERLLLHERPPVAALVETLRGPAEGAGESVRTAMCLVRGGVLPIARLHRKIKGVDGTASAEVPLVSFEGDAFKSYGKERGDNAPTSEAAAFQYSAALNALLERGKSRNRLRIGDATIAFWADTSETIPEEAAQAAEDWFGGWLGIAPAVERADTGEADAQEAAKVRDELVKVAEGRPGDVDPRLRKGTRFHVLGLSPNAARLSVRYWLDDDFTRFAAGLARFRDDIHLEPSPRGWKSAPSINRLLVKTTALAEDFKNIPNQLAGEVMRAVLAGTPYPQTLLAAAIIRLRAGDDPGTGWHAAVIKACLNRSRGSHKEALPVKIDPKRDDCAYQLGRLFAVLESAQREALGRRVNATIGDRYYAAASSTPARVFGALMRGLKVHVADARKRKRGLWIESKVGEIVAMLPPDLPTTLRLAEQGRFAIGYYHERATRPAKPAEGSSEGGDTE